MNMKKTTTIKHSRVPVTTSVLFQSLHLPCPHDKIIFSLALSPETKHNDINTSDAKGLRCADVRRLRKREEKTARKKKKQREKEGNGKRSGNAYEVSVFT